MRTNEVEKGEAERAPKRDLQSSFNANLVSFCAERIGNRIATLPTNISIANALLTSLDLTANQITSLPSSITGLSALLSLVLDENPIKLVARSLSRLNIHRNSTMIVLKRCSCQIDAVDGVDVGQQSAPTLARHDQSHGRRCDLYAILVTLFVDSADTLQCA